MFGLYLPSGKQLPLPLKFPRKGWKEHAEYSLTALKWLFANSCLNGLFSILQSPGLHILSTTGGAPVCSFKRPILGDPFWLFVELSVNCTLSHKVACFT